MVTNETREIAGQAYHPSPLELLTEDLCRSFGAVLKPSSQSRELVASGLIRESERVRVIDQRMQDPRMFYLKYRRYSPVGDFFNQFQEIWERNSENLGGGRREITKQVLGNVEALFGLILNPSYFPKAPLYRYGESVTLGVYPSSGDEVDASSNLYLPNHPDGNYSTAEQDQIKPELLINYTAQPIFIIGEKPFYFPGYDDRFGLSRTGSLSDTPELHTIEQELSGHQLLIGGNDTQFRLICRKVRFDVTLAKTANLMGSVIEQLLSGNGNLDVLPTLEIKRLILSLDSHTQQEAVMGLASSYLRQHFTPISQRA